jgi:hypothetical protein
VYRKADRCKLSFPAIQPPPHCPDDRCDSVFAVPQLDNVHSLAPQATCVFPREDRLDHELPNVELI